MMRAGGSQRRAQQNRGALSAHRCDLPKGSFDFLSREWLVGIVFNVHRRYLLDSFANSEGVAAAFEGRLIGGGGLYSSETLKGWAMRSEGNN
jgi:hypothetical protein